jgi:hypothetical protein
MGNLNFVMERSGVRSRTWANTMKPYHTHTVGYPEQFTNVHIEWLTTPRIPKVLASDLGSVLLPQIHEQAAE